MHDLDAGGNNLTLDAEHIDRLFKGLVAAHQLLATGRSDGLVIGLSPALAEIIARRHGERAELVLNNTWRVNPKGRRDVNTWFATTNLRAATRQLEKRFPGHDIHLQRYRDEAGSVEAG